MDRFLEKHSELITGNLSCFDRVIFKGCLHLNHPRAMEQFLDFHKVLYKDLKPFLVKQAERIKAHAQKAAADSDRPYEYFEGPVAKEERACRESGHRRARRHPRRTRLCLLLSGALSY